MQYILSKNLFADHPVKGLADCTGAVQKPGKIFQRRKGVDRRWHDVPVKVERRRGERRKKKQDGPDKPDLDWDISEAAEDDSWLRDDEVHGSVSGVSDLLE